MVLERIRRIVSAEWAAALVTGLATAWAWANRFVQDDAFISFRYAKNCADGHGLVWNIGERVEGYTNYLWTLAMTPAFLWKGDPVVYSYAVSLAAFVCTLALAYRLAADLWGDRRAGFAALFLLGTNYSFSCYATGGLETQFGIAWALLSIWLLKRVPGGGVGGGIAAGLACACAVMARMDAVLLIGPAAVWVASRARRNREKGDVFRLLAAALAAGVPLAAWLVWRHAYYGEWVPNTFHIKAHEPGWARGLYYIGLFYGVYGLWLLAGAVGLSARRLWRACADRGLLLALGVSALAWHVYVAAVGGDFMEFRFLMPSLPLVAILSAGVCGVFAARWRWALAGVLAGLSLLHGVVRYPYPGIQTVGELKARCGEWQAVAEMLGTAFGKDCREVKIGVTCAGVIPFYTGFPSVDLLGLNDREIARYGEPIVTRSGVFGNRPGHVRMASWKTVEERGVHLLINTPWIAELSGEELAGLSSEKVLRRWFWENDADPSRANAAMVRFPFDAGMRKPPPVIAWPMGKDRYCMTVYVKESPLVEAAVRACGARFIR